MGTGRVSPDASVSRGENGEFNGRQEGQYAPLSAYEETLSGDTDPPSETGRLLVNYEVEGGSLSDIELAAADPGYHEDLAAHFRSKSTSELRETFDERTSDFSINDPDARMDEATRFVGGMLVSREDSNMSAADMYHHRSTEMLNVENAKGDQVKKVMDEMDRFFETVDEYVAGQVASQIDEISFERFGANGRMKFNGKMMLNDSSGYVTSTKHGPSRLNASGPTWTESISEFDRSDLDRHERVRQQDISNVVVHEMMHAYHHSIGLSREGGVTSSKEVERTDPDDYEFDYSTVMLNDSEYMWNGVYATSEVRQEFAEDIKEAGNRVIETEKGEVSPGEPELRTHREYQKANFAELIACGYEMYQNDVIASVNEQRQLADTFDRRLTGEGWEETSADELRTTGGREEMAAEERVADRHFPRKKRYDNTEDFGEVALFELDHDGFDGQSHAAGVVTDVTDDAVTFTYCGQQLEVDRNDIQSVKRRDWNQ